MAIVYLSLDDCIGRCFPYIKEYLQFAESAPNYERDKEGMTKLGSILYFVEQDELYGTFPEKAAYLFCSVSNGHAFGNGNKRLAATLLRYFLSDNHVKTVDAHSKQWEQVTFSLFPDYEWKNSDIGDPFYLLLYNLAFIAADSQLRPGISFDDCKGLLTGLFNRIFEIPGDC